MIGTAMIVQRLTLAALLLLAIGSPLRAQDDDRDALLQPLPIRDQFLLNTGFFFFEPETAHVMEAGSSLLTVQTTDANTFAKSAWVSRSLEGRTTRTDALTELSQPRFLIEPAIFFAQGESERTEFAFRRALSDELEVGVNVPVLGIGGGWSDQLIESIHHFLGVGNAQRESLRKNAEAIYIRTPTTLYVRSRSSGFGLGDIAVTAKYELKALEDPGVALAISGAIELPTGATGNLDGSGSLDGGLQLLAMKDFGRLRVNASLGLLRLGANRTLGTHDQTLITNTVGLSRMLTARMSATAQLTVSECPFRNLGLAEFNRRSYQLSTGIQRRIGRSTVAYLGVIENLLSFDNSADAGLAWGVSRQF